MFNLYAMLSEVLPIGYNNAYRQGVMDHNQLVPLKDVPFQDAKLREAWRRGWIRTFKIHKRYPPAR